MYYRYCNKVLSLDQSCPREDVSYIYFLGGVYVFSLWACSGLPVSRLFVQYKRKKNEALEICL